MHYRRFGKTELQMPVFSTGGMRYQQSWKKEETDAVTAENQHNLEATIRRSIDIGINHIETAYGYGTSEYQLGKILPTYPREKLIVQTKVGPKEDPEEFRKEFHESLSLLQLDYVDLLGLHGINNQDVLKISIPCLEVARELQAQGKVRHVGFSTHGYVDDIIAAINTEEAGGFDYVNIHWYYIFQHNWPAIEAATRRDMGVFIISPSDKGGMLYKPSDKLRELTHPLHPIVFNDLFCLDRQEVHTLSLGASKPSDYDEHLEAVELCEQRHEFLGPIIERIEKEMERVAGFNFIADVHHGVPRWDESPGEINIPVIRWLYWLAETFGMEEYGKMRYGMLGNGSHWFPGQHAGKLDELQWPADLGGDLRELLSKAHKRLYKGEVKRLSESDD